MEGVAPQPVEDLHARVCEDCQKPIRAGYIHQVGRTEETVLVVIVCRECNVKRRRQM